MCANDQHRMILQIRTDASEVFRHGDASGAQLFEGPDTRP